MSCGRGQTGVKLESGKQGPGDGAQYSCENQGGRAAGSEGRKTRDAFCKVRPLHPLGGGRWEKGGLGGWWLIQC